MNLACKVACVVAFGIAVFFGTSSAMAHPPKGDVVAAHAGKSGHKGGHKGGHHGKHHHGRHHGKHGKGAAAAS